MEPQRSSDHVCIDGADSYWSGLVTATCRAGQAKQPKVDRDATAGSYGERQFVLELVLVARLEV